MKIKRTLPSVKESKLYSEASLPNQNIQQHNHITPQNHEQLVQIKKNRKRIFTEVQDKRKDTSPTNNKINNNINYYQYSNFKNNPSLPQRNIIQQSPVFNKKPNNEDVKQSIILEKINEIMKDLNQVKKQIHNQSVYIPKQPHQHTYNLSPSQKHQFQARKIQLEIERQNRCKRLKMENQQLYYSLSSPIKLQSSIIHQPIQQSHYQIQQQIQKPIQQPIQYQIQYPIQQQIHHPIQQPVQHPIHYLVQSRKNTNIQPFIQPIIQPIIQPVIQSVRSPLLYEVNGNIHHASPKKIQFLGSKTNSPIILKQNQYSGFHDITDYANELQSQSLRTMNQFGQILSPLSFHSVYNNGIRRDIKSVSLHHRNPPNRFQLNYINNNKPSGYKYKKSPVFMF